MDLKPLARAASRTAFVISKGWTRFTAIWTRLSKSWTPILIRLKPALAKTSTLSTGVERGSTSMEISASGASAKWERIMSITWKISSLFRKVGEPPPKWSCTTSLLPPISAETSSHSLLKTSKYSLDRQWSFVTSLLQPQKKQTFAQKGMWTYRDKSAVFSPVPLALRTFLKSSAPNSFVNLSAVG